MGAAHRTRRRTQLPKRRKQIIHRRTVYRKLQPKRRKQQVKQTMQRWKLGDKQAQPPKQNVKRTCDEFVSKVLRQLHRDRIPISTKAKGKMISFIRRFYNNVSNKAKSSKRVKRTCTIGTKELQNALKRVMRKKQAMELARTVRRVSRRRS